MKQRVTTPQASAGDPLGEIVAEEAILDVYVQVWRQAQRYISERGSVTAWLMNLARSRAIDLLRSRSRHADSEQDLETAGSLEDEAPGPEQWSLDAEKAGRVRMAMASLPAGQRRAIEAVYFEGLSHTEVADVLGEPLGTVKTRIRTGLATLRRALSRMEGLV